MRVSSSLNLISQVLLIFSSPPPSPPPPPFFFLLSDTDKEIDIFA